MDDTPSAGCHKLPHGKHGDVGPNGDLVNRLRSAVGTCTASVDAEAHVLRIAGEIQRVQEARRAARVGA